MPPLGGKTVKSAPRPRVTLPAPTPASAPAPASPSAPASATASDAPDDEEDHEQRPFRRTKEHYRARVRTRYGDVLPGDEPPGTLGFFGMLQRDGGSSAANTTAPGPPSSPPPQPSHAPSPSPTPSPPPTPSPSHPAAPAAATAVVQAANDEPDAFSRLLLPRVDQTWLATVTPMLYRLPFPSGYFGRLDDFERNVLKIRFKQSSLLLQIFMHDSFLFRATNVPPAKRDLLLSYSNLKLSYVGDTILNLMLTSMLLQQRGADKLADWSARANHMRSNQYLKHLAVHVFHMESLVLVGNANVYKEGKLAADAMEALIGAIYLDQGLRAAVEFVQTRMLPHLTQLYEDSLAMRPVDPVHVDDHDAYFRERLGYVDELTDAPAAPPADAPGGA